VELSHSINPARCLGSGTPSAGRVNVPALAVSRRSPA
jgi:hypothetical protein